MRCRYLCALVVSFVLFDGCGQQQKTPPLFRLLTPDQTGVRFANTITTTDSENVQTDVYVYNGAGCLDLFLLNNSPKDFSRAEATLHPAGLRSTSPSGYNQLYRNNCDGTFTSVSEQAGILRQVGYGLGVAVTDFNGDGRPDIYVSNDVAPNDVLYINNGDGTFTDKAARWLKHTSHAGSETLAGR